ncbi:MAG: ATP-binding cassette domain-containing protein [Oscillospiraceae bacterium]|jgi:D-methionine transport system ATP-binding protein|nr:ATP-binding cassette domain-containing protein [Oscillospiraceae bacterium]
MSIIELQGLGKRYPNGLVALEGIDLTIEAGEVFGIIGKSGAGKSTLARCVNFLERPTAGEVLFEGQPLSRMSRTQIHKLRQSIGMIFQQFNLLMQRTVTENISFPMEIAGWKRADIHARAAELLALVGLEDKAKSYPKQLSGGQRQRVAIARALATHPKVLICDEATSALDPGTTRDILSLLRDINRRFGLTILVITHEMRVVETICHRVAILGGTHVAEVGNVREVFANPRTSAARELLHADGGITTDGAAITRLARLLEERGLTAEEVLERV